MTPLVTALASFIAAERKVHEAHPSVFLPEYVEGVERDLERAGEAVESELRQMIWECRTDRGVLPSGGFVRLGPDHS